MRQWPSQVNSLDTCPAEADFTDTRTQLSNNLDLAGRPPCVAAPFLSRRRSHMAKQVLVIDGADQAKLFLSVAAGTLTVGSDPKQAEFIFRNLHIARIHCEVEVDEDRILADRPPPAGGVLVGAAPRSQELHAGDTLQ